MVCGVALSILAHLSACSYVFPKGEGEWSAARERIKLGIGALKQYGETWEVGQSTLMEIKRIAVAVLEGDENSFCDVERADYEGPELCEVSDKQRTQDMVVPDEVLYMANDEAWNAGMGINGGVDISTILADANFQDSLGDAVAMDDWNFIGTDGRAQPFVL